MEVGGRRWRWRHTRFSDAKNALSVFGKRDPLRTHVTAHMPGMMLGTLVGTFSSFCSLPQNTIAIYILGAHRYCYLAPLSPGSQSCRVFSSWSVTNNYRYCNCNLKLHPVGQYSTNLCERARVPRHCGGDAAAPQRVQQQPARAINRTSTSSGAAHARAFAAMLGLCECAIVPPWAAKKSYSQLQLGACGWTLLKFTDLALSARLQKRALF